MDIYHTGEQQFEWLYIISHQKSRTVEVIKRWGKRPLNSEFYLHWKYLWRIKVKWRSSQMKGTEFINSRPALKEMLKVLQMKYWEKINKTVPVQRWNDVYIENPMYSTEKFLELNEFIKGCRIKGQHTKFNSTSIY